MSAYAYEVPVRQQKDSKRKYLSGVSIQGTVQRRKAGVLYAEAWIIGVHKRVDEFSGVTEEVERAIHAYTQRNYPAVPVTKMKRRKLDMDAYRAYIQGKRDGESVSLHKPMGRDEHRHVGIAVNKAMLKQEKFLVARKSALIRIWPGCLQVSDFKLESLREAFAAEFILPVFDLLDQPVEVPNQHLACTAPTWRVH